MILRFSHSAWKILWGLGVDCLAFCSLELLLTMPVLKVAGGGLLQAPVTQYLRVVFCADLQRHC